MTFMVTFLACYCLLTAGAVTMKAISADPLKVHPVKPERLSSVRLGMLLRAATLVAIGAYLFGWWS